MRPDGLLFLVISWGFIGALTVFCFVRILTKKTV